jgi:hypothetical protein
MTPRRAVLVGLGLVVVTQWASSDALGRSAGSGEASSAVNSRGYDRNTAFVSLDGPAINAFNLNFMVQFPLAVGLNYPCAPHRNSSA